MIRTAMLAVMTLIALSLNAEARQRHKEISCIETGTLMAPKCGMSAAPTVADRREERGRYIADHLGIGGPRHERVVSHPANCPRIAFCGCGAAVRVFGHSVRELWLAANWFKFPRANPSPGMVAVRRHHVMVLESDLGGGTWQVYDANSGHHLTRIHARSLAGFIVVNPHGAG